MSTTSCPSSGTAGVRALWASLSRSVMQTGDSLLSLTLGVSLST